MMITEEIEVSDKILASGGFADTWTGTYVGHLVAVKTLRVAEQDDFLKIRKVSIFSGTLDEVLTVSLQQFCKEVVLWNTLSHPNVVKFAGIQGDMEKGQFITVSEWMAHGNIMEFIGKNHVNRLELVRDLAFPAASFTKMQRQLHGAARGLEYLHSANLTHGDLKGVSISPIHDGAPFLMFNRRTSLCPMTTLHVPASRTSVL